jgi:hypothetical protein
MRLWLARWHLRHGSLERLPIVIRGRLPSSTIQQRHGSLHIPALRTFGEVIRRLQSRQLLGQRQRDELIDRNALLRRVVFGVPEQRIGQVETENTHVRDPFRLARYQTSLRRSKKARPAHTNRAFLRRR